MGGYLVLSSCRDAHSELAIHDIDGLRRTAIERDTDAYAFLLDRLGVTSR